MKINRLLKNFFAVGVVLVLAFLILANVSAVSAQEQPEITFFYSPTCPHCAAEEIFLDELEKKYPTVGIIRFDVTVRENYKKLEQFYGEYQVPFTEQGSTPVTFIDGKALGHKYFVGYSESINPIVGDYLSDLIEGLKEPEIPVSPSEVGDTGQTDPTSLEVTSTRTFNLPFIGEVDFTNSSPFVLSMAVGALDGFNACAMIALAFLLTILVTNGTRKKVLIIGGTFILVSGAIYYIFISAWLNLFLFLGFLQIITWIIAVVIIIFAILMLKDYIYGVVCKICEVKEDGKESVLTRWQRGLMARMGKLTNTEMSLWALLLGVVLVAAGVNMIELFCSLGFPLAYTKILTSYSLSTPAYYWYLLVYVVFYMIDDFIIFMIAVVTLRITGVSEKYLKIVKLISGIILLALGILLILRPELLAFH